MEFFGNETHMLFKEEESKMKSIIFEEKHLKLFQNNVLNYLKSCSDFEDKRLVNSPRAVGDVVQEVIGENLNSFFADGLVNNCNNSFARRAMADMAFFDTENNYFVVDIKTHNKSTSFNMPNLISVDRLARFYEEDNNYFVILLVEYHVENSRISFDSVRLFPIENLAWSCLTIGALGWGQIQIANANIVNVDFNLTRKKWMLSLCDTLDLFYPKEIEKINKRIDRFKKVREFWENK